MYDDKLFIILLLHTDLGSLPHIPMCCQSTHYIRYALKPTGCCVPRAYMTQTLDPYHTDLGSYPHKPWILTTQILDPYNTDLGSLPHRPWILITILDPYNTDLGSLPHKPWILTTQTLDPYHIFFDLLFILFNDHVFLPVWDSVRNRNITRNLTVIWSKKQWQNNDKFTDKTLLLLYMSHFQSAILCTDKLNGKEIHICIYDSRQLS